MKLAAVLALVVLGVTPTSSAPVLFEDEFSAATDAGILVARQSTPLTCPRYYRYSVPRLHAAYIHGSNQNRMGTQLTAAPNRMGIRKTYPQRFNNAEGFLFTDCPNPTGPLQEFPILRDGTLFQNGKRQGTDRVIYEVTGRGANGLPNSFRFCGAVSHFNQVNNGLIQCT